MRINSPERLKPRRTRVAGVLPRERLFRLLDQLRDYPLWWIGGCPGAGKTTLIASFLERRQLAGIWHHLDGEDRDPQTCLDDLDAVLGRTTAQAASRGQATLDAPASPAALNRRRLRDLYHRLPQPGALVLDDCHEVSDDAPLHTLLADSARDIPHALNVILIGRGEPPGAYARLVANRTLAVLDARDLQLTADETRALACGISVDERAVDTLHRRSGGWAAGVAIALERLRRSPADPEQAEHETREAVFHYFAGEVFDRATPEEQRLLVSTALVPHVSALAAEKLTGRPQAPLLLGQLARQQRFTFRTAGSTPAYEYAPRFREFLLSRVEGTLTPSEFTALARRASVILEELGELEASVALHVRTQDWDALLGVLCRHGMRLTADGHGASVRSWLERVPVDQYSNAPWLTYWSGAASISVDPVAARTVLEKAWLRFEESVDSRGQMLAAAAILETYQLDWSTYAPVGRWIDRLEACLATDPTFPSPEVELRVYANLLLALSCVRPSADLSAVCIARLQVHLEADLDVNHRLFAARALLLAHCSRLDVDRAREVSKQARSMLLESGGSPLARSGALNAMAYCFCLEGTYADAEALLKEALSVAGQPLNDRDPLHHLSRQLLAFAHRDRAEMAESAYATRRRVDATAHVGMTLLSQALAEEAILRRDMAAAVSHFTATVSHADKACWQSLQWSARLALSGCLAAQRDCTGATRVLQQARALAEGADASAAWSRDGDLLAAYVALCSADRVECHRLLAISLESAPSMRVSSQAFSLLPAQMAELCKEALRAGIAGESVRNLIQQYRLPPPASADREWPWPFKVHVLGRFRVLKSDAPIRFSRRAQRKPLELLQALIAFGGAGVGAGALTDALWPDSDGDAGYHALESALYRLRQLLGSPSAVTMAGGKLSLDPQQFWVDMWAFERELQSIAGRGADAAARLTRMRQLYEGHFLEQESERPWALKTRQALRDKFLRTIRDAARSYESQRRWQEAADVYQTGIDLDSLSEDLYRGLMVCHRELGDHTEALHAYRRCRDLLGRILGVPPTAKTQAIYHSVRQSAVAQPG